MPIVTEPASLSGHRAGNFYRAVCDSCETDCPPRPLHNPATAKIAAESRGWLVDGRVLCPGCRTGPKFAA